MKFSDANSEANQERRADAIERIAAESLLPSGECHPFTKENFAEAVRNMPEDLMTTLWQCSLGDAKLAGVALRTVVKKYWEKCALLDAAAKYKD